MPLYEFRKELGLKKQFTYHWIWKNRLNCPSSDYIIVDEIQDFEEEEIQEFITATKKHFFFFGDTAQSIYEDFKNTVAVEDIGYLLPRGEKPKDFGLYRNYRLPIPVAKFVQYVGVDLQPFEVSTYKSPEKVVPRVLKYSSVKEQLTAIKDIIRKRDLTDVAILFPRSEMVRDAEGIFNELNLNVESRYNNKEDWHNSKDTLNFSTTNPKIMTYHSAKGLQFETIFLPQLESFNDFGIGHQKSLYVAMTRTYRNLYIMYSGILPHLLAIIPTSL